jgi:uncharacterized protein YndB with AHSA1/START domain
MKADAAVKTGAFGSWAVSAWWSFRPRGFFHMGMRSSEGYKMWGKFVYQEIVPPERIVFVNSFSNQAGEITRHPIVPTWPRETRVMVKPEDQPGGKTRLNVRWTPHNATEVEQKAFTFIWHGGEPAPLAPCRALAPAPCSECGGVRPARAIGAGDATSRLAGFGCSSDSVHHRPQRPIRH